MKLAILLAVLVSVSGANSARACDELVMINNVKTMIEARVGTPPGSPEKVIKVENIRVLGDSYSRDIRVLFSYDETLADGAVFHMIGYSKFDEKTCAQVDRLLLGSTK